MTTKHQPYLTRCRSCGITTSRSYAKSHGGDCKQCAEVSTNPTRNERIIDCGYQAYAMEEGHYDHE